MRSRRSLLAAAAVALVGSPTLVLIDANRGRLGKSRINQPKSRIGSTDAPEYIKAQAKRDRKNQLRLERTKK